MRRMLAVRLAVVLLVPGGAGAMRAQAFKAQPAAALQKTRWTLTWVDGTKIGSTLPRPAFIELDPASRRLTGSGGCNQLMGTYELEGDRLRLTGTARTMMACANGMDTEDKLVKALNEVREWKTSGERLELLDGSGNVVARFSANTTEVR